MTTLGFTTDPNAKRDREEFVGQIFAARQVAILRVKQLEKELRTLGFDYNTPVENLGLIATALLRVVDETTDSIAEIAANTEDEIVAPLRARLIPDEDLAARCRPPIDGVGAGGGGSPGIHSDPAERSSPRRAGRGLGFLKGTEHV